MPTKEELLAQATALGKSLAEHERVRGFLEAQKAVQDDTEAQKALGDYTATADLIRRKEIERKPIEPEEKRKLAELERALSGSERVKTLMRRQADYL